MYYYRQRVESIVGEKQKENIRHLDIIDALEERIIFSKKLNEKNIYMKIVSSYRQTIIIQYHTFRKQKQAWRLKLRFLKSFILYPMEKKLIKSYIIFSINAGWYYKKYWK